MNRVRVCGRAPLEKLGREIGFWRVASAQFVCAERYLQGTGAGAHATMDGRRSSTSIVTHKNAASMHVELGVPGSLLSWARGPAKKGVAAPMLFLLGLGHPVAHHTPLYPFEPSLHDAERSAGPLIGQRLDPARQFCAFWDTHFHPDYDGPVSFTLGKKGRLLGHQSVVFKLIGPDQEAKCWLADLRGVSGIRFQGISTQITDKYPYWARDSRNPKKKRVFPTSKACSDFCYARAEHPILRTALGHWAWYASRVRPECTPPGSEAASLSQPIQIHVR